MSIMSLFKEKLQKKKKLLQLNSIFFFKIASKIERRKFFGQKQLNLKSFFN